MTEWATAAELAADASFPALLPGDLRDEEGAPLNGRLSDAEQQSAPDSSWTPVDLTAALDGHGQPPPILLPRSDDRCLIYEGRLHEVAAPPESGKGWLALAAALEPLTAGYSIVYVDFEGTAAEAVERLKALGVPDETILSRFDYFAPCEPLRDPSGFGAAIDRQPPLVVLDGVTEGMTLHGLDLHNNADVAKWLDLLARPAARSGAAVLLLDHVVKDPQSRGSYSLGAGHKLAGVDVAYSLAVAEPFGRGREGVVSVKVRKDRPAHVRAFAAGDDVATMRLVSGEDGAITVTLEPPEAESSEFRPTVLMERLSEAIEKSPGLTTNDLLGAVKGKTDAKRIALRLLVDEGYVRVDREGQARRHYVETPYRESEGPRTEAEDG